MTTQTLPVQTFSFYQHVLFIFAVVAVIIFSAVSVPYKVFAQTAPLDPHNPADVETAVKNYFADIPAMPAIAKCESSFRQFDYDGSVLFDPSYSMIGVFQVSAAHLPESIGLGMDIMTLNGNMAYAKRLYMQNGIDPWMDSFGCWGSQVNQKPPLVLGTSTVASPAPTSLPTPTAASVNSGGSSGLALGMTGASVLALQQLLNKVGFVIAASGAGSPGNETNRFGSLTRNAVRRFQCAKSIVCSGDESTTGYGMVDDRTYQALLAASGVAPAPINSAVGQLPPNTTGGTAMDKAAQIAQVESQISALVQQLDTLNKRLGELTR